MSNDKVDLIIENFKKYNMEETKAIRLILKTRSIYNVKLLFIIKL